MRAFSFFFLPALAYQMLAIVAALNHLRRRYLIQRKTPSTYRPPVSVLKPLRGLDPNMSGAFVSQAHQNYPEFELLFGVANERDAAAAEVERLQGHFPQLPIRLIVGSEALANGKVGVLARLAQCARHPVWIVNDSDITVTPEYLAEVAAPLEDSSVGVVTCLYRVRAHSVPAAWEALGVAIDFMPSVLVAQLVGVREFGLGSTLVFRAADLERAGGFHAFGDYLADDYQLARRITALGKRAVLSTYTVETSVGDASWRRSWQHQLRWARTIRFSKGGGFAGMPITQAGIWIALALASGDKRLSLALLALRVLSALLSSLFALGSGCAASFCWLAPVWDLYSFAVWLTSYAGRQVRWRDRILSIDGQGRIRS